MARGHDLWSERRGVTRAGVNEVRYSDKTFDMARVDCKILLVCSLFHAPAEFQLSQSCIGLVKEPEAADLGDACESVSLLYFYCFNCIAMDDIKLLKIASRSKQLVMVINVLVHKLEL